MAHPHSQIVFFFNWLVIFNAVSELLLETQKPVNPVRFNSTPPVTSPEYHETSLLGSQLRIFISKSLTLQSLGVRFIPTFGSNFGPNHKVAHIHWDSCFYFLSFHSQASRGKCLSLPKPPAACRAELDSPNSLSVFPLDPSIPGFPKPGVQLMLEIP